MDDFPASPAGSVLGAGVSRKLSLLGLGLLAVLGVVLLCRTPDKLARYRAELMARGERFDLSELVPPPSFQARQNLQAFEAAAARLPQSPVSPSQIELMHRTIPGWAQVTWRQPQGFEGPAGTEFWRQLTAEMDEAQDVLHEIRKLLEATPGGSINSFNGQFGPGSANPGGAPLIARRRTAQALAATLAVDLHRGRLDAALTNLDGLIALGSRSDPAAMLVDRMIQVACASLALAATWECLQAPGWDQRRLEAVQARLGEIDFRSGFPRTAEIERAYFSSFYAYARSNNLPQSGLSIGLVNATNPLAQFLNNSLYTPVWQKAWSRGDELRFLQTMQSILAGLRQLATNSSYQPMRAQFDASEAEYQASRTRWNRFRFQLNDQLMVNWRKATLALMRAESLRQLALTVLALRRYQLQHGSLPDELTALVPAYLPAPPRDPMDGQTLRYRRLDAQRFRLHSVGENGADDQGQKDDITWPEPEVPDHPDKRNPAAALRLP